VKTLHIQQYPERLKFFGSYLDPLTMSQTLNRVEDIISEGRPCQHVVINVAKLVMMQSNDELKNIVNNCELINVDGQGVVWGARWLGLPVPERVAGIDLFLNIVALAQVKGYRLYFLGAKQEIVSRVVDNLTSQYPDLQIAGYHDGYFQSEDEEQLAETIRDAQADVIFVAMPSPKKEEFIARWRETMRVPFMMGVGGSFDVVAGLTRRAPVWMQRAGLEWFYRLMCEPGRMWKRYLTTNWAFLGMLCRAKVTLLKMDRRQVEHGYKSVN
jgi:N-acetylglucosaminyldiphosphoundecaprenol N-acetyl-beta-D-mannosaminyltransferase